jgi:hypothetical protein
MLDLQDTLKNAATDKDRSAILRKMKRALSGEESGLPAINTARRRPYRARGFDES